MTMNATEIRENLVHLLGQTVRNKGRIEITDCEGGSCVMISKDELDSLEKALEILSDTAAGKAMHHAVAHFATMAAQVIPEQS